MKAKWSKVERSCVQAAEDLKQAATEEQFQAIGLFCREALISLAQVVYDPGVLIITNFDPPTADFIKVFDPP